MDPGMARPVEILLVEDGPGDVELTREGRLAGWGRVGWFDWATCVTMGWEAV